MGNRRLEPKAKNNNTNRKALIIIRALIRKCKLMYFCQEHRVSEFKSYCVCVCVCVCVWLSRESLSAAVTWWSNVSSVLWRGSDVHWPECNMVQVDESKYSLKRVKEFVTLYMFLKM